MRYLGIDYGEKRIGLALSDESGKLAFPKTVLGNDKYFWENFKKICLEEKIQAFVLGESKNFQGENNPIFEEIKSFKEKLEKEFDLDVFLMPEYLTTVQAKKIQGENKMVDASAAAIILQSFLDYKKGH